MDLDAAPRGRHRDRHGPAVRRGRRDLRRAVGRPEPRRRGDDADGRRGRLRDGGLDRERRGWGSRWRCWPAALLSLLHAVVTIHLRADQVVSGLALTFLGTGLALVLGEGLSSAGRDRPDSGVLDPAARGHPGRRADLLPRPERARLRRLPARPAGLVLDQPDPAGAPPAGGRRGAGGRRRPGHLVYRTRYAYVFVGGLLAGLAGATITLAVSPGWFSDLTTAAAAGSRSGS